MKRKTKRKPWGSLERRRVLRNTLFATYVSLSVIAPIVLFFFFIDASAFGTALANAGTGWEAVVIAPIGLSILIMSVYGYVANEGRAVIIGECGTFDERGKRHEQPLRTLLDPHSERVRYVEGYADLVPDRGDEMYELSEELTNSWGSGPPDLPDRAASVDEAQSARNYPLVDVLRALTGERLTFLGDTVPYTLRVNAYRDPASGKIIVHLVNYDLPVTGRATSGPPIPARDVHLAVPAKSARAWIPNGMQGEELPAGPDGVRVPEVEVYAMIEVTPL